MTVTALISYSQSQSSICGYDALVAFPRAAFHLSRHLDKLSKQLHDMEGAGKGWLLVLVPKETAQ